ncbi:MAG: Holliday junction branch migration protein RuvA [Holosporales bacterium]|jgi:Holliday junction DNA helicase RuvA|nr:Holliday junction branch migration protein RuvA [Holosporales bacterium]
MIAQLEGQVTWVGSDTLVLKVQGVGYLISGTASVLQEASRQKTLSLWIETLVREDAISLYGFLTRGEQELFRLLLGVQGVGARVGLNLLSTFGEETLLNLLALQDKKSLIRAEGVGGKLAERLVIELRDKVTKLGLKAGRPTPLGMPCKENTLLQESLQALTSLGYRSSEILPLLEKILAESETSPSLETLIRQVLSLLSKSSEQVA